MIFLGLPQAGVAVAGGLYPSPSGFPSPTRYPQAGGSVVGVGATELWGVTVDYTDGDTAIFSKSSAYLSGAGGTSPQTTWMAFYENDLLLGVSDPVVIVPGMDPQWVDYSFPSLWGAQIVPDTYTVTLWGSNDGTAAEIIEVPVGQISAHFGAHCVFEQQSVPSSPEVIGAWTPVSNGLPFFVTAFDPYVPPSDADNFYLGRLAWEAAQRGLGAQASLPRGAKATVANAVVGWHGVNFDVETGAFALARKGGSCEELVGSRILVVRRGGVYQATAAVYLYAIRVFPTEIGDEDLSLTRRAFLAVSGWERDSVVADIVALDS